MSIKLSALMQFRASAASPAHRYLARNRRLACCCATGARTAPGRAASPAVAAAAAASPAAATATALPLWRQLHVLELLLAGGGGPVVEAAKVLRCGHR